VYPFGVVEDRPTFDYGPSKSLDIPANTASTSSPHPTQRMIDWNPIFQRHITEHPRFRLLIVPTHAFFA
jgi:hypothetical protein